MMTKWYVISSDRERGPFSDVQLKQFAANGKLKPEHRLRRDGSAEVLRAKDVEGLFQNAVTSVAPGATSNEHSFTADPKIIIFLSLFMPPLGLLLVWKHPRWTTKQKWRWAGLPLVLTSGFVVMGLLAPIVDPEGWKRLQEQREAEAAARRKSVQKQVEGQALSNTPSEDELIRLMALTAVAVAARDESGANTGPSEFTALMRSAATELGMDRNPSAAHLLRIEPSSQKTYSNNGIEGLTIWFGEKSAKATAGFARNPTTGQWQLLHVRSGAKEWDPIGGIRDAKY